MNKIVKQNNSLNLFKLIAAIQVLYGHTITHLSITSNSWFDKIFTIFQGVPVFFALSGFLIWFSIERTENKGGYQKYIKKRFWRIYPEMWVAIAIEIIVMCVLYNGWNIIDTSIFAVTQGTVLQFWTPNSLRGYGCGTPNGSLWTICVTIQFYIIAWFIYKFLKNQNWRVWSLTLIASIIISQSFEKAIGLLGIEIILKLYYQTIVRYLWLFILGMGAACFFDKIIPFCKKWWPVLFGIGMTVLISGFDYTAGYGILKTIFVFFAILGFAYKYPQLKLKNDISFGIFIYHMTIVNAMIALGLKGEIAYLIIVCIISCILGYISTITIGKYATQKK